MAVLLPSKLHIWKNSDMTYDRPVYNLLCYHVIIYLSKKKFLHAYNFSHRNNNIPIGNSKSPIGIKELPTGFSSLQ